MVLYSHRIYTKHILVLGIVKMSLGGFLSVLNCKCDENSELELQIV